MKHFSPTASVTPWLYSSIFPIHRIFLSTYFSEIIIQGSDHLPEFGPVVFAPKHFSRWDPLIVALLSTEPLFFMTNANQFEGIQGWFLKRLGAFPVDLNHPTISSLRCVIELLQAGKKLVLFPEGGIVCDQPLRPLKTGLARLVLQAEGMSSQALIVPIVPIALHYEPGAYFRAKVIINIGSPLYTQDYRQETDKQTAIALTQALQASLLQGLESITNK
ncbi:MAG TPA: lysophospholipid acyltransferase family protein [Cyanophyceae cyanobacterium]